MVNRLDDQEAGTERYGVATDGRGDEPKPTVLVEDAHVTYRIRTDVRPRLKDLLRHGVHASDRSIEALRGVSFSAYEGQIIGIVGRNGQGKSTLLRAIGGLLPVTSGAVYAVDRPALLGVSAALQGQLSGRRNIILGGLAIGLSPEEIDGLVRDILEFAGLQEYADIPLRAYSSGMRARLHFALATAVKPRILLIDEVLSVGDEDFRNRSRERLEELRDNTGTVFVVSHNLRAIRSLCNRALWLEGGQIQADGSARHVTTQYANFVRERNQAHRRTDVGAHVDGPVDH